MLSIYNGGNQGIANVNIGEIRLERERERERRRTCEWSKKGVKEYLIG